MGKSVGTLHTIVSANAEPYVNELRRAGAATKAHANDVDYQFDKLRGKVAKKFSISDTGFKLLKGAGFGSAAGVGMHAFEKISELLKESGEYAAKLEERAKSVAEAMQAAGKSSAQLFKDSREDPQEKLELTLRETAAIGKQIEAQQRLRDDAMEAMGWASKVSKESSGAIIYEFKGKKFGAENKGWKSQGATYDTLGIKVKDFFDLMLERADLAQKKVAELTKDLNSGGAEAMKLTQAATKKAEDERIAEMGRRADEINLMNPNRKKGKETPAELAAAYYRGQAAAIDFQDELEAAKAKRLGDIEKLGAPMRVDDMTRRGLGTGGGYAEAQKGTQAVLVEIRDLLKRRTEREMQPAFSD